MSCDVCPWWLAYSFDNWLRRWIHDPARIFGPYVRPGMTVLDIGSGMGFSALAEAKLAGEGGCVVAVDLQRKMLEVLRKRAAKAGVAERIRTHQCSADSLGIEVAADFAAAFWMVHEVPNQQAFFAQVAGCLKPGAKFLIAEPRMHVTASMFASMLETARAAGLTEDGAPPRIRLSRSVVLVRAAR